MAAPSVTGPDGKVHRLKNVEFTIRTESQGVYDTALGFTVKVRAVATKIQVAVDDGGNVVHLPNGDPLVLVGAQNIVVAQDDSDAI